MPTRQDVVNLALSFNGYLNGQGYDGANRFGADLGHLSEAWCADSRLPGGIQGGCPTGFAYVPAAVGWARARNAVVNSWAAEPGGPGDL